MVWETLADRQQFKGHRADCWSGMASRAGESCQVSHGKRQSGTQRSW